MPLSPTNLIVDVKNPHYIRFPMDDGSKTVTVHIATSSLKELAARDQRIVGNIILLYCAYREAIEAAASLKYDQAPHRDSADIVVVASDIA